MPGKDPNLSRRKLFERTSKAAIAAAVGGGMLAKATGCASTGPVTEEMAREAVNYNPKMKYRRLGKTNLPVSEISLGGHWKNRKGGRFWGAFANDEVPDDVAKNRTEVMSACIDAGVNYLDITTAAECLCYGVALKGRREKMHVGADDHRLCIRNPDNCTVPGQTKNVEECLRRLRTDYLDIWRVQARMDGTSPDEHMEVSIEAADKLRKAGKIRHFGVSSHNRKWLKHIIEKYPGVEMVIFPCTATTRKAGQPITKENIIEKVAYKWGEDLDTSIFDSVRKHNVGVVTIKPFAGGNVFASYKNKTGFPVMGVGIKEENDLARLTLQCILTRFDEITCVVPGLTTVYEVDNAARASYLRNLAMTPAEQAWLERVTAERLACLPEDYKWLRDWDVI